MNEPVHFMDVVPAVLHLGQELTDMFGRIWTHVGGELYRHDRMTWTRDMVLSPNLRGPSAEVVNNPNYVWCKRCRELVRS